MTMPSSAAKRELLPLSGIIHLPATRSLSPMPLTQVSENFSPTSMSPSPVRRGNLPMCTVFLSIVCVDCVCGFFFANIVCELLKEECVDACVHVSSSQSCIQKKILVWKFWVLQKVSKL
jgi:hypothetical protein